MSSITAKFSELPIKTPEQYAGANVKANTPKLATDNSSDNYMLEPATIISIANFKPEPIEVKSHITFKTPDGVEHTKTIIRQNGVPVGISIDPETTMHSYIKPSHSIEA